MSYYNNPKSDLYRKEFRTTSVWPEAKVDLKKNLPVLESKKIRNDKLKNKCLESTTKNVEDYLTVSTLHGLRYVGSRDISVGERLFWIVSFGTAAVLAVYFINQVYAKYDKNPVITTVNPIPVPPHLIPFPAITICSMNAVMINESQKILNGGSATDTSFLEDICDFNPSGQPTVYTNETEKFENFMEFIQRVSPPCDQSLKVCMWHEEEKECLSLFHQVLTDDGICCVFNQLPLPLILKDSSDYKNFSGENITYDIDNWNPEDGYTLEELEVYPFRSYGPGAHLGLTVVLDAEVQDYYCSSTSSAGFKVLLHSPLDIPQMSDFSFMVPPGFETRIIFNPIIYDTVSSVRSINIDKRRCYFNHEKPLAFYRKYSQNNCKMECLANTTVQQCQCVPFYLHTSGSMKTCGKLQDKCIAEVRLSMETTKNANEQWCDCLPSCNDLEYQKTLSYGLLTGNFKIRQDIIKDVPLKYFTKNMAILHFFFVSGQFTKFTKSELYGFSEFLSNTGGLLGLFLGFSSLSVVEFVYHFTLRIFCIYVRDKRSDRISRNSISNSN